MGVWLDRVSSDETDFGPAVAEAYEHFDREYEKFKVHIDDKLIKGQKIVDISWKVSGLTEVIHSNWTELGAIVDYLETRMMVAKQKARRRYIENYNRDLNATQVNQFAEAEVSVTTILEIIGRVRLMQQKWEGLSKALERLHFQMRNIIELYKAGMEDLRV